MFVLFIPYFWNFGHFSFVIFFPFFFLSCPSCLAQCKQRLHNIFVNSSPKMTKNQKWDEQNIWQEFFIFVSQNHYQMFKEFLLNWNYRLFQPRVCHMINQLKICSLNLKPLIGSNIVLMHKISYWPISH